jgi:hypothetical protein
MLKSLENSCIILLLNVDNILVAGSSIKINNMKKQLFEHFAMKDLGAAKQILSIKITRY